jgi:hypothetical protein
MLPGGGTWSSGDGLKFRAKMLSKIRAEVQFGSISKQKSSEVVVLVSVRCFQRDWLWFINAVGDNILSLADFCIGRYFY